MVVYATEKLQSVREGVVLDVNCRAFILNKQCFQNLQSCGVVVE